eukprot:jgi/Chrpa1/16311/Chrysochromulina_OHIO_Genome00023134-RA
MAIAATAARATLAALLNGNQQAAAAAATALVASLDGNPQAASRMPLPDQLMGGSSSLPRNPTLSPFRSTPPMIYDTLTAKAGLTSVLPIAREYPVLELDDVLDLAEILDQCSQEEGTALGQTLREQGTVIQLSRLLTNESDELVAWALYCLANICSDALDLFSAATKQQLLTCDVGEEIVQCLTAADTMVVTYAAGLCLNLSKEPSWGQVLVQSGGLPHLEQLVAHEENLVVHYAKAALANLMNVFPELAGTTEPDGEPDASSLFGNGGKLSLSVATTAAVLAFKQKMTASAAAEAEAAAAREAKPKGKAGAAVEANAETKVEGDDK